MKISFSGGDRIPLTDRCRAAILSIDAEKIRCQSRRSAIRALDQLDSAIAKDGLSPMAEWRD